MRVPRDLNPFVMSSSFLTNAPHNANVSHGNSNEFHFSNDDIASVSHGNSDEFDISNDTIATVIIHPLTMVSTLSGYTRDEINIAVLLTTCSSSCHLTGKKLVNTCPIDNRLMIFQSLAKSGRLNLHNLNQAGELINVALQLIILRKWFEPRSSIP